METTTVRRDGTKISNAYSGSFTQWRGALLDLILLGAGCWLWMVALALVGGDPALAQQGGGGDAIQGTLANVRDYIASLLLLLGGIGFVVSLGLKAASPINENAQYLSNMGMKSSFIAVLGGAIVGPVMDIIQGLAAA
jgi:hypothetical protein